MKSVLSVLPSFIALIPWRFSRKTRVKTIPSKRTIVRAPRYFGIGVVFVRVATAQTIARWVARACLSLAGTTRSADSRAIMRAINGRGAARREKGGFVAKWSINVLLGSVLVLASASAVQAAELQVIAGGGIAGALNEIAAMFERVSGHKVVIRYGTAPELIKIAT